MSNPSELITAGRLRKWGLPDPGESKKSRGRVLVVGGSRRSPGAVLLAGEAALRVGAGRLGLAVPQSTDAGLGFLLPEAAVFALPEDAAGPLSNQLRRELHDADAVLVGPGFDDASETRDTLLAVAAAAPPLMVLDAFALGVLPRISRGDLPRSLILNANKEELGILLGHQLSPDLRNDAIEVARHYDAVVNCYGTIATSDGTVWTIPAGGAGLATSGSGDVLAGAITGFAARGAGADRAVAWGSWTHATAGDRLTDTSGIGFLARDLLPTLTLVLRDALA